MSKKTNCVTEFFKLCPTYNNYKKCKNIIYYSTEKALNRAIRDNSFCVCCCTKKQHDDGRAKSWAGENNPWYKSNRSGTLGPFYGRHHTDVVKKFLSEVNSGSNHVFYGKTYEEIYGIEEATIRKENARQKCVLGIYNKQLKGTSWETRFGVDISTQMKYNISQRLIAFQPMKNPIHVAKMVEMRYKNGGFYHTSETILKIRLKCIETIQQRIGQMFPAYNICSIHIMEQYGKENGYNFQHAENGGEVHIKSLGYWLDGYDKENNVVIEFYERRHYDRLENLDEKDLRREREIINHLSCKYIRINAFDVNNLKFEIL